MKYTSIVTQGQYRFVHTDEKLPNGKLDLRIQKYDGYTNRYKDMYLLDNAEQMYTAIEDAEYTKWLDPDDVPCYLDTKKQYH